MSRDLANSFYAALAVGDGETMANLYAPEVVFEDPAFGVLNGTDAGDMWRMLCSGASDLRVTHTIKSAGPTRRKFLVGAGAVATAAATPLILTPGKARAQDRRRH